MAMNEDLVAVWKVKNGQRFQNYRAVFTILNEPRISREWISDIHSGRTLSENTPESWRAWVRSGRINPLLAPRSLEHRKRLEQIPQDRGRLVMIEALTDYFKDHPRGEYAFEECAVDIVRMMDSNIRNCDLTRPWRDGGRDAVGGYRIGHHKTGITVEFALEAKCHAQRIGSGVRETSRLISRLRHRQFGIFVTTSYVSEQAYKEIVEDKHPVFIIAANDIVGILQDSGINSVDLLLEWLQQSYPYDAL